MSFLGPTQSRVSQRIVWYTKIGEEACGKFRGSWQSGSYCVRMNNTRNPSLEALQGYLAPEKTPTPL